jgi:hypothetical protein
MPICRRPARLAPENQKPSMRLERIEGFFMHQTAAVTPSAA